MIGANHMLLNIFLYFVIAIYTLAIINNSWQILTGKIDNKKNMSIPKSPQIETLITTVKTNKYLNPAKKNIKQITKAQMMTFIKEQQLKDQVEAIINKKLYKACKLEIYNGLKAL
jgi:hypothetical protein